MSTKRFKTRFVNWNPYDSSRNTLPRKSITSLITTQNQSCYYNLIFTKVKIKTPIKEKNNKKGRPKIKFKRRKKNRIPAPRFRWIVLCEPELAENSGEIMKDIHGIVPINKFHLWIHQKTSSTKNWWIYFTDSGYDHDGPHKSLDLQRSKVTI